MFCIIGPYMADFKYALSYLVPQFLIPPPEILQTIYIPTETTLSHTHIQNPAWPPHAKFHNGQTMSLGVLLGLLSIYYTWRPSASIAARKDSMTTATLLASLYWIAGLSAILYPGTAWVDAEFVPLLEGKRDPQKTVFSGMLGAAVIGWGLEMCEWRWAARVGRPRGTRSRGGRELQGGGETST
jgi:hypothetical protein